MNNDEIFKYIKPYDNDMFSKMKGFDLQNLIYYINNYYLTLRNNLEIKELEENIGFGIELECEHADFINIKNNLYNSIPNWKVKHDTSLDSGAEIISPILHDNKQSWEEVEQACSIADENAIIDEHSGGHLHIGAHILNDDIYSLLNLLNLWLTYENIIYRFSYGEYLNPRNSIKNYARPLSNKDTKKAIKNVNNKNILNLNNAFDFIHELTTSRYIGINIGKLRTTYYQEPNNTIEFRCPNGSIDPVIWQNNLNFFANMVLYSQSDNFNYEIINNREKINGNKYNKLNLYNEIFLPQSLELCDMIFDKNIDKVYFLRQYLKSFEVLDNNKKMIKAKTFTLKKGS